MKQILYLVSLFIGQAAFAQTSHELKISTLDPLFKMAHFSYEFKPDARMGLELMLRYNWGVGSSYSGPGWGSATQRTVTATLTQKIYPLGNRKNWLKGWFAGLYFREDWLLSRPEVQYEYFGLWHNYAYWKQDEGNSIRLGAGMVAGYQYFWGRHFFVEGSLGYDANLYVWLAPRRLEYANMDVAGIPGVKAGWRF